jgi:hypothetical protein
MQGRGFTGLPAAQRSAEHMITEYDDHSMKGLLHDALPV